MQRERKIDKERVGERECLCINLYVRACMYDCVHMCVHVCMLGRDKEISWKRVCVSKEKKVSERKTEIGKVEGEPENEK